MNLGGSGTDCRVSFGSDDEGALVNHYLFFKDRSKISCITEMQPNPAYISTTSLGEIPVCHPLSESQPAPASLVASSIREGDDKTKSGLHEVSENLKEMELPSTSRETSRHSKKSSKKPCHANQLRRLPIHLTRKQIEEAIWGPKRNFTNKDNYQKIWLCDGYLPVYQSRVLMKVFKGDCSGILEAEKTSALSMHHKYILELIGCHNSCEDSAVLIYPFAERGSLDEYLTGSGETRLKLAFADKLNMAIKIAKGIRYMHEECPGGPVVHGDLQPRNICLTYNFRPLMSGFGKAKWLYLRQALQITPNRFRLKDFLDHETMSLVKSDVHSFGVLLFRMFCRRSAYEDDESLIKGLARPLVLEGALPELLDDDSKDYDPYGVYTLFCAAAKCTSSRPDSRPCMSEVIIILKQERFCHMQLSPPTYLTMRSLTLIEFPKA